MANLQYRIFDTKRELTALLPTLVFIEKYDSVLKLGARGTLKFATGSQTNYSSTKHLLTTLRIGMILEVQYGVGDTNVTLVGGVSDIVDKITSMEVTIEAGYNFRSVLPNNEVLEDKSVLEISRIILQRANLGLTIPESTDAYCDPRYVKYDRFVIEGGASVLDIFQTMQRDFKLGFYFVPRLTLDGSVNVLRGNLFMFLEGLRPELGRRTGRLPILSPQTNISHINIARRLSQTRGVVVRVIPSDGGGSPKVIYNTATKGGSEKQVITLSGLTLTDEKAISIIGEAYARKDAYVGLSGSVTTTYLSPQIQVGNIVAYIDRDDNENITNGAYYVHSVVDVWSTRSGASRRVYLTQDRTAREGGNKAITRDRNGYTIGIDPDGVTETKTRAVVVTFDSKDGLIEKKVKTSAGTITTGKAPLIDEDKNVAIIKNTFNRAVTRLGKQLKKYAAERDQINTTIGNSSQQEILNRIVPSERDNTASINESASNIISLAGRIRQETGQSPLSSNALVLLNQIATGIPLSSYTPTSYDIIVQQHASVYYAPITPPSIPVDNKESIEKWINKNN